MASPEPTTSTGPPAPSTSSPAETSPTQTDTTAAPAAGAIGTTATGKTAAPAAGAPGTPAAGTTGAPAGTIAPPAAAPATQATRSAVSRSPIAFLNHGKQVYVPLSAITFAGGRAIFPAEINGIQSGPNDPLGIWINHLVKVGTIKPGPLLPPASTKA
jgi:hypothetical protein